MGTRNACVEMHGVSCTVVVPELMHFGRETGMRLVSFQWVKDRGFFPSFVGGIFNGENVV